MKHLSRQQLDRVARLLEDLVDPQKRLAEFDLPEEIVMT